MRCLAWGAFALLVVGASGCRFDNQSPIDAQRKHQQAWAKELSAAELESKAPTEWGVVHPLRVRFYETAGYRAAQKQGSAYLERWLERANQLLEPNLSVRLELDGVVEWAPASAVTDLDALLRELEGLEAGTDVDFVVGLVPASGAASIELHDAGRARVLGKHSVLRAMDSVAELQLIRSLDMLDAKERSDLYADRLEHKQTTVLLHELGHNLGALHAREPVWIMHPSYHHEMAGYAPANRDLMAVTLRYRRGEIGTEPAWFAALQKAIDQVDDPGVWVEAELAEYRAHLASALTPAGTAGAQPSAAASKAPGASAAPSGAEGPTAARAATPERDVGALPAADAATVREALALYDAGDPLAAWSKLQPLLETQPDSYAVQHLGCTLAMSITTTHKQRRAVCGRMSTLAAQQR